MSEQGLLLTHVEILTNEIVAGVIPTMSFHVRINNPFQIDIQSGILNYSVFLADKDQETREDTLFLMNGTTVHSSIPGNQYGRSNLILSFPPTMIEAIKKRVRLQDYVRLLFEMTILWTLGGNSPEDPGNSQKVELENVFYFITRNDWDKLSRSS